MRPMLSYHVKCIDLVSPAPLSGMTALMNATISYNVEVVRLLLNAPDMNTLEQDKTGRTALHWACATHLALDRAPFVLYGVKYIDLVSLVPFQGMCCRHTGMRPVTGAGKPTLGLRGGWSATR